MTLTHPEPWDQCKTFSYGYEIGKCETLNYEYQCTKTSILFVWNFTILQNLKKNVANSMIFFAKNRKTQKSFKISTFVYMVQVDSQKHTSMLKF